MSAQGTARLRAVRRRAEKRQDARPKHTDRYADRGLTDPLAEALLALADRFNAEDRVHRQRPK